MKKLFLLIVIVGLLAVPMGGALAQEDEAIALPACSEEELAGTLEAITEMNAGFEEIATTFDLSSDPNDNAYGETLVVLDAFTQGYWSDFFVQVPPCAEATGVAYVVGSFYEEYLITGLLLNIAAWADASGDTETATMVAEQANLHLEDINATMEALSTMTFEELAAELFANELPACTPEQLTEAEAAFGEVYEGLSSIEEEFADDTLALFAASEAAAYTFDTEVYAEASTCAELASTSDMVSLALNIANSAAGLYANAEVEEAAGNTEVASAMQEAAQAREEAFAALLEMSGEE
jgi:hypothetical protein